MLGRIEGIQKRGSPNIRWIDSLKEAPELSLSRAVEDRTFWRSLIHRITIGWRWLDSMYQPTIMLSKHATMKLFFFLAVFGSSDIYGLMLISFRSYLFLSHICFNHLMPRWHYLWDTYGHFKLQIHKIRWNHSVHNLVQFNWNLASQSSLPKLL